MRKFSKRNIYFLKNHELFGTQTKKNIYIKPMNFFFQNPFSYQKYFQHKSFTKIMGLFFGSNLFKRKTHETFQKKKVFLPFKRRETILFFLIVVINGLIWIDLDIGLDTCARGRWRVEVSKMEMNQSLGSSYLTAHLELPYPLVSKWLELILYFYYGKWRAINPFNGLSVWAFSFFRNSLFHH